MAAAERLAKVYQSQQQKTMDMSVKLGEAQARAAFYQAASQVHLLSMNTLKNLHSSIPSQERLVQLKATEKQNNFAMYAALNGVALGGALTKGPGASCGTNLMRMLNGI